MPRLSSLTPVIFLCSVRPGSGKSTMLVHLAVYLNNLGRKIAIVDLNRDTPDKVKNTIPRSISFTKYRDIVSLREAADSRYQRTFYFTENDEIAYFPAQQIEEPGNLFTDTTFRDFLLQARSCYDLILINFPSGTKDCLNASGLLAQRYLWANTPPACLLFTQSEIRDLNRVDQLLKSSRSILYQLRENLMLIFNKVPLTVEEQRLLRQQLTPSELKELYEFPHMQIIGNNEEYLLQRSLDKPIVLENDSLIHQTIATMYRNLKKLGEVPAIEENTSKNFRACLDGILLERLAPYLDSIHQTIASKLFIAKHQVQVFLEENESTYRIRVRISDYENCVLGISPRIASFKYLPPITHDLSFFDSTLPDTIPLTTSIAERPTFPRLKTRRIFRFDDSILWNAKFEIFSNLPLIPNKKRYPSPIYFKQYLKLPEIPSLSHLLGYQGRLKKHRLLGLRDRTHKNSNLTHFFIPPAFSLSYDLNTTCQTDYIGFLNLRDYNQIKHVQLPSIKSPFNLMANESPYMPSIFARDRSLIVANFIDNIFYKTIRILLKTSTRFFSCTNVLPEIPFTAFIAKTKHNLQPNITLAKPLTIPICVPKPEGSSHEYEIVGIKSDFEKQFSNITHRFKLKHSTYSFLNTCNLYSADVLSMNRFQFANTFAIKQVFPKSILPYTRPDLEISLHIFKPAPLSHLFAIDYYSEMQNEILPNRLKLNSILLHQQLNSIQPTFPIHHHKIQKAPRQHGYTPNFNVKFLIDYLVKQSLYTINIHPHDRVKEFSFLLTIGKPKLPEKKLQIHKYPVMVFDMLKVGFKYKKDNSELCSNFDHLYCSNHLTDPLISNKHLEIRKRDMLSIIILSNSRLKSFSVHNKKKLALSFSPIVTDINFNLNISQPCLKLSDRIKQLKKNHCQQFNHASIRQSTSAPLFYQNYNATAASFKHVNATFWVQSVFNRNYKQHLFITQIHQLKIPEIDIYLRHSISRNLFDQNYISPYATFRLLDATFGVQPVISRNYKRPVFTSQTLQLEIPEINIYLNYHITRNYIWHPKSSIDLNPKHTPLKISVVVPFRSNKSALKLLRSKNVIPYAINKIFMGQYQIRDLHKRHSQNKIKVKHKKVFFKAANPLLSPPLIFNKLFDPKTHIVQLGANFRVQAPYSLDVLYDHLIYSSRYHFTKLFDHSALQSLNKTGNNELAVTSNFQNRVSHYHFLHHPSSTIGSMLMPLNTKQFSIRNFRLNDLLKMARQASQQFSKVKGKITP